MKRFIPVIVVLSILLSSCGSLGDLGAPAAETTPTLSVEEIRATADSLVYEMLTQTAVAMPTNTPIPPTATPMPPTATATLTMVPTTVADTEATPEGAVAVTSPTAAVIPTNTLASTSSSAFPCTEKPLTSWDVPSVNMKVSNTVPDTTANVFLCITTEYDAGYISIPAGASASIPYGTYTATAWVTGKKSFNDTIFFEVKTSDGLQIVIENGRVFLRAGCAPNC